MNARITRFTILSEHNYALGRFYEGFFHMRPTGTKGPLQAVEVSDGHIELTIKPRLPGLPAQLHHFGIDVDDPRQVVARIGEKYPGIAWLEKPVGACRAPISTHDPAGNFFDVFQRAAKLPGHGNGAESRQPARAIDHFALRVLHPEQVAEFYVNVFGLSAVERSTEGQKNFYLSDGHLTLVIIPWCINDFQGTGITARGMDHIGFRVESIAALKSEIDAVTQENYRFQPRTSLVGRGKEGGVRLTMFRKTCPLGHHHMADSDGFLLDVVE